MTETGEIEGIELEGGGGRKRKQRREVDDSRVGLGLAKCFGHSTPFVDIRPPYPPSPPSNFAVHRTPRTTPEHDRPVLFVGEAGAVRVGDRPRPPVVDAAPSMRPDRAASVPGGGSYSGRTNACRRARDGIGEVGLLHVQP